MQVQEEGQRESSVCLSLIHGSPQDTTGFADSNFVVYGTDEYSGAEDLVTALLEEPFASDSHKQAIQNRWKGADGRSSLLIR